MTSSAAVHLRAAAVLLELGIGTESKEPVTPVFSVSQSHTLLGPDNMEEEAV